MLYFIQTTRFIPIDYKQYGFKVIDDNTILLEKNGSIWKSIKLYDLGCGRENGFYRTPMPKKEELFFMVFPKEIKNDFNFKTPVALYFGMPAYGVWHDRATQSGFPRRSPTCRQTTTDAE